MEPQEKTGVLLINMGTPAAPTTAATRAFLGEFLSDPRVMDVPAPVRWLLLHGVILRFRPKRSAEAYRRIWTEAGSPLSVAAQELQTGLRERMPEAEVAVGMRYGAPSIAEGLDALFARDVARIVVAPLFPQYASATTGSALEYMYRLAGGQYNVPPISVLPAFYDAPEFVGAWAAVAGPILEGLRADHIVLSYHGLPERHIRKGDATGRHCLATPDCCDTLASVNRHCYRAQCFATTRALARRMGWAEGDYTTCFQSRLGRRDPWIQPATQDVLPRLARDGAKRVAVLCPSFVADCLETLEEIGIAARRQFLDAGGAAFELVPCLNAHPAWLDGLAGMLRQL